MIYRLKRNLSSTYLGYLEIVWLLKMMKLVSLRLETQADSTLHSCELYSQHGREGLHHLQRWRELGTQTSGQYCKVHCVAKFHFHW
jgi:hypothetical protein